MRVVKKVAEMQRMAEGFRKRGRVIGLFPTMGALHKGHIEIIRDAREKVEILVVSIFVNPLQFGPGEDYERYPRDLEGDVDICRELKVDIVFAPPEKEMISEDFETFVEVTRLQNYLCGVSRPGHFRGVTTIVAKLFNIVKPHVAFFGLKDYQQAMIIKKMVRDLDFDVKLEYHKIVREEDGLACSSRNKYLTPEERKKAVAIYESLQMAKSEVNRGLSDPRELENMVRDFLEKRGIRVDYVKVVHPTTLENVDEIKKGRALLAVAGYIGNTRLIDNALL